MPSKPQCRQAEQKSEDEADDGSDRQRPDVADAELLHHDCRSVGADGVERSMTQRELAVETGEQVETHDRDGIDQDHRELEDVKRTQTKRQRNGRRHNAETGNDRDHSLAIDRDVGHIFEIRNGFVEFGHR